MKGSTRKEDKKETSGGRAKKGKEKF